MTLVADFALVITHHTTSYHSIADHVHGAFLDLQLTCVTYDFAPWWIYHLNDSMTALVSCSSQNSVWTT